MAAGLSHTRHNDPGAGGQIAGIILHFATNGSAAHWQWWDGLLHTLAPGSIKPGAVALFGDGVNRFSWQTQVGDQINPAFHMQVLLQGASLSFDAGDIYAVPPLFAPGI